MRKKFLDSSRDKKQAESLRDDYAKTLVALGKQDTHGVYVRRIPGTGYWGVYIDEY